MEENQKMLAVKERNKTQFHTLTDQEVLSKTKHLASEERKITAQIIEVLEEIDTRKLYAKLGFSSLFDFLTEEIGYSAGAAQRRINSMRVVRSIPEVKDKIIEGSLNLSNVAQAQKFFNLEAKNSEPLSIEEKKIVLSKLENKSTREAEKELLSLSSNPIQMISDRVKPVTSEHSEIRFMASNELIEKLNQVRGLIAHKNPQASMAEVIDAVVDIGIKQLSKNKFKTEKTQPPTDATLIPTPTPTQVNTKSKPNVSSADTDTPPKSGSSSRGPLADREAGSSPASPPKNRNIPSEIKRVVAQRDRGKCTYRSPETEKLCNSTFGLEYEHLRPYSHGGEHSLDNLTLRCRAHNTLSAKKYFGNYSENLN